MTDEIMKSLRAALPAHLSADGPVAEETRGRELSLAFTQARESAPPRRRRRLLIMPAVAAGAAAIALAVSMGGNGTRLLPGQAGPAILAAADRAEQAPTGEYWYTDQIQGQSYIVQGGYAIVGAHSETFEWTSVKAGGGNLFYGRDLPARPLTKADERAWRKAGSPSSFRVWSNDHYGTYTTRAGAWQADRPQARQGGSFGASEKGPFAGMTVSQLQKLPTDPAELARMFDKVIKDETPAHLPKHVIMNSTRVVDMMADVLRNVPLPPKVRAGVMKALGAEPGVRSFGAVTDQLGRRGIAIGVERSAPKVLGSQYDYSFRRESIFDPETGDYLGNEDVLTMPGGLYAGQQPGFVINYWLERGSGWTDKKPAPPKNLPFR